MKITFLMNSFYEINTGGAEYQAYMIAKEFGKEKHNISFIFTKAQNENCRNKYRFKLYPIIKTRFKKIHFLKLIYFIKAYKYLKKAKPDVIYHRTFSSFLLLAQLYKLFHRNVKIILHISHDEHVLKYKLRFEKTRIVKNIDDFFRYVGLYFTENIITQSYYQRQSLLKNYNKKSIVIRNFCELEDESRLNAKEDIIVWVANIKPIKNPFLFIKLANEMIDNKYRFLMIGKPPESKFKFKFYQMLQDSNVEYLGKIKNEEVNEILCKSKILCCTSYVEGFSNTFLQAWARKVPVLSLYVDPDDLIKRYGLGYHSKSYSGLKKDFLSLTMDSSEYNIMANRVRNFAENNFSINDNFYKLYNTINKKIVSPKNIDSNS